MGIRVCKSSRGWKRCKRALRRFEEVSRRFREGGWGMETVLFISLIKICSFPKFFNFFDDPLYGIHPSTSPPPSFFPTKNLSLVWKFETSSFIPVLFFYFTAIRNNKGIWNTMPIESIGKLFFSLLSFSRFISTVFPRKRSTLKIQFS